MKLRTSIYAILLHTLATPALVFAQAADAESFIRHGVALRRRGDAAHAMDDFRRAFELSQSPRARAQMALAAQELQRWSDAEAWLTEALGAANDPWIRAYRGPLETARREVAAHLADLDVVANVPGAVVTVDDHAEVALPLARPLRLPAGTVNLRVRAAGYAPVSRVVDLRGGTRGSEAFTLAPLPPPEAVAARTGEDPPTAGSSAPPAGSTATATAAVPWVERAPTDVAPVVTDASVHRARRRIRAARRDPVLDALAWVSLGGAALFDGGGVAALVVQRDAATAYNAPDCADRGSLGRSMVCPGLRATADAAGVFTAIGLVAGGALTVVSVALFVATARSSGTARAARWTCAPGVGGLGCAVTF